jgi:hypothetical protein
MPARSSTFPRRIIDNIQGPSGESHGSLVHAIQVSNAFEACAIVIFPGAHGRAGTREDGHPGAAARFGVASRSGLAPRERHMWIGHNFDVERSGVFAFPTTWDWLDIRRLFDQLKIRVPSQTGRARAGNEHVALTARYTRSHQSQSRIRWNRHELFDRHSLHLVGCGHVRHSLHSRRQRACGRCARRKIAAEAPFAILASRVVAIGERT